VRIFVAVLNWLDKPKMYFS